MTKRAETVRINSRIGKTHNDWLDDYSRETGISKSSLVMMAVDDWITKKESIEQTKNGTETLKQMIVEANKLMDEEATE